MKKAFTLVELIFVIVILGILSIMSTDLILNVYRNYIYSKAINELESKVEVALEQITARLTTRIRPTTIAREVGNNNFTSVNETSIEHKILEWYGQSTESRYFMSGNLDNRKYGWSGFLYRFGACGYKESEKKYTSCYKPKGNKITQIRTPATNFSNATEVIKGYGSKSVALIFLANNSPANYYNIPATALPDQQQSAAIIDLASSGDTIKFSKDYEVVKSATDSTTIKNHHISERYYISHSAYAISPQNLRDYIEKIGKKEVTRKEFDLSLHYNYYPWDGVMYNDKNTKNSILLKNVTLFRFRGNDNTIEIKLCARDPHNLPNSQDFIVCKSKVVL